jgi:hypothetical protein
MPFRSWGSFAAELSSLSSQLRQIRVLLQAASPAVLQAAKGRGLQQLVSSVVQLAHRFVMLPHICFHTGELFNPLRCCPAHCSM